MVDLIIEVEFNFEFKPVFDYFRLGYSLFTDRTLHLNSVNYAYFRISMLGPFGNLKLGCSRFTEVALYLQNVQGSHFGCAVLCPFCKLKLGCSLLTVSTLLLPSTHDARCEHGCIYKYC